jgi:hypothetical protein
MCWLGTHYTAKAGLKLTILLASQVLLALGYELLCLAMKNIIFGTGAYFANTLPLELYTPALFALVIFQIGSTIFSGPASVHDPLTSTS